MAVQPLNKRILVKPKEGEQKTAGGIYIPDSAKENKQEGTVVAVAEMEKCPVAVGDSILYESFSGTEIKINNEKHLLLKVEDILAKITK
ncbi:co-chaperone GroES [Candidatus Woesearchaeota archaeon CG10_big_fil_rev_8_21_14_0_10_34_8]|nr:MAG: co-chaperone GroES [Candidatus Woesearchaeota archaeon CG10_big_fil_rev_8_21_14_0_10_34_8]